MGQAYPHGFFTEYMLFSRPEPLAPFLGQYPGKSGAIYAFIYQVLGELSTKLKQGEFSEGQWTLMETVAEWEGVAPLLYWHLEKHGWPGELPDTVREQWTCCYYNTVAQNSLLYQELEKVLQAFERVGIPVMVLKGAALALFVYPEIGLRPMNDLDLLIPEAKVDQALAILGEMGYREVEAEIVRGVNRKIAHNAYLRGGPDGRVGLEIHWNLIAGQADDRAVSAEWFWGRLEQSQSTKQVFRSVITIPHLDHTAHLLYLAAHLVLRHGGADERLIWFYDVDRLVRSGQVDWDTLVEQAQRLNWGALVRYVLEETSLHLNIPVPAGVREQLAEGEAWAAFVVEQRAAIGRLSRLERTWGALEHITFGLRVRLLVALVFPRPAYLKWRYKPKPAWVWPLFYAYRWGDLGRDLLRWGVSRPFRD